MIQFQGDRDFPLPPAEVWAKLSDPRFLVQCVPDVEKVHEADERHARWTLRPGFSFVRGTIDIDMQVADKVPDTSAKFVCRGKAIGSTNTVEAAFVLSPTETGTHLHWTAEVKELTGLLKMVPQGLIRGGAQKVLNDVWASVEARLTAPPA